jgi:hypothetical protein
MKTNFEKIYVGKGKNSQPWATRITLNVDELLKHAYEFEGKNLVTIEVAEMKKPDNFGRTHSAYISVRSEDDNTAEEIPTPNPKKKK